MTVEPLLGYNVGVGGVFSGKVGGLALALLFPSKKLALPKLTLQSPST